MTYFRIKNFESRCSTTVSALVFQTKDVSSILVTYSNNGVITYKVSVAKKIRRLQATIMLVFASLAQWRLQRFCNPSSFERVGSSPTGGPKYNRCTNLYDLFCKKSLTKLKVALLTKSNKA